MVKLKTFFIGTICGLLLVSGCKKGDNPSPKITDQASAEHLAWAVESYVGHVASSSSDMTWTNATVSGIESGSAVVNGSFTSTYNALSGRSDETYNNVVIQFNNFGDDSYYPHLTGTVTINGTCTTYYGWNTTYSGQWELAGQNLHLSGALGGTASIAMLFKNGGMDWAAIVQTSDGTWNVSN